MNKVDFAYFKEHKIIPPAKGNSEMFTSPTLEYITAGDYRGIIVKFQMKPEHWKSWKHRESGTRLTERLYYILTRQTRQGLQVGWIVNRPLLNKNQ